MKHIFSGAVFRPGISFTNPRFCEKFLDCAGIIHYNVWDYENYF